MSDKNSVKVSLDNGIVFRLKQALASGRNNGEKYELFYAFDGNLTLDYKNESATIDVVDLIKLMIERIEARKSLQTGGARC